MKTNLLMKRITIFWKVYRMDNKGKKITNSLEIIELAREKKCVTGNAA